ERERGAVAVALVGPPRGGDLPDRGLLQRLHREPWGGRPDDHDERPHLVLLRQAGPADRDRVDRGIRRDVLRGRGGGDRGAGGDRDGRAVPDLGELVGLLGRGVPGRARLIAAPPRTR